MGFAAELANIETLVRENQGELAESIYKAISHGWVKGARFTSELVPTPASDLGGPGFRGPRPPRGGLPLLSAAEEPTGPAMHFPGLERAVESLVKAEAVQPEVFYSLAAGARDQAFTISGDLTTNTIDRVREILAENVQGPASRTAFSETVRKEFESLPISDAHLEQVYRNVTNSAYSQGMDHVLENPLVVDAFPWRAYFAIHDDRCRPEHLEMETLGLNGTNVYHKDDPTWKRFEPPWDWNCILPGQLVQGTFSAGFKSWYDGECVELITRKGNHLSVTINHPVLTSNGLRAAGTLRKGERLLSYGSEVQSRLEPDWRKIRSVWSARANDSIFSPPDLDEKSSPAAIEEVLRAIRKKGASRRMRVGAKDFHGDAATGNGYVDVVTIDRELLLSMDSNDAKGLVNVHFCESDSLTTGGGSERKRAFAGRTAANGEPRSGALALNGGATLLDCPPLRSLRVGPASQLDATIYETPADDATVNADRICEGLFRCSSQIEFDELVDVKRYFYVGHVYDLRADGGWILAQNLFVSNCRCGWSPISTKTAAKMGVLEAKQWLETGIEPTHALVKPPEFSPPVGWDNKVLVA